MKKKILSLLIAAVLLLCFVPFVGASSGTTPTTAPADAFIIDSSGANSTISTTPKLSACNYFTASVGFQNITTVEIIVQSIEMITSTDLSVFPFEVVKLNYVDTTSKTVAASGTCSYKMDNLRCRGDAPTGYYDINFKITYTLTGSTEIQTQTLSLPMLVTAAETTPEGSEVPTIIITGFYTSPSEIIAGEALTLFVTFKNTSSSTAVSNLKAQLTSDGTFTPINGSSTLFADSLGPNASTTMSIHLDTKAEAAPGSYSIGFNISYSYPGATTLATDNETISVPVTQVPKIKVTAIQTSSTEVFLGQEVNVMSQINNTGKGTIYNVTVKFADTNGIFTESESYLGNIAPGSTGNIDVYLPANSIGEGAIQMNITYEDEGGEVYSYTDSCSVFVSERVDYGGMDPYFPEEPVEEPSGGISIWLIVLIVIVLAVIGLIVFLSIRKKNKKKLQKYMDRQEALRLDRELLESENSEDAKV